MLRKYLSLLVSISFFLTFVQPPANAQALRGNDLTFLPKPGSMVALSKEFKPPVLRGIKVSANNPLKFDFILDPGDSVIARNAVTKQSYQEQLKAETTRLLKYFLTTLTVPDNDIWVNLSPYEKDRIITEKFGQTEMGRDLLSQDYLLKQITASLIFPEGESGKKFWARIYQEAQKKFGSTQIPVDTFNKVWIMPDKAIIYEKMGDSQATAFVIESSLKVMLEEDYLALKKHANVGVAEGRASPARAGYEHAGETRGQDPNTHAVSSQIVREVMIPILQKEVNEGANFAPLRQVYNSILLALWYKKRMEGSILSSAYVNRSKVAGVDVKDKAVAQKIWRQYVQAYKKGAVNLIKEDVDPATNEVMPRKYFAGGFEIRDLAMTVTHNAAMLGRVGAVVLSTLLVVGAGCTESNPDFKPHASPAADASAEPADASLAPDLSPVPDLSLTLPYLPTPTPASPSSFYFDPSWDGGWALRPPNVIWGYNFQTDSTSHKLWRFDFEIDDNNMMVLESLSDTFYPDETVHVALPAPAQDYSPAKDVNAWQKIVLYAISKFGGFLSLGWNSPGPFLNAVTPAQLGATSKFINILENGLSSIVRFPLDVSRLTSQGLKTGNKTGIYMTIVNRDLYIIDSSLSGPDLTVIFTTFNFDTGEIQTTTYDKNTRDPQNPVSLLYDPQNPQSWLTAVKGLSKYFDVNFYNNYPGNQLSVDAPGALKVLSDIVNLWAAHGGFMPPPAMPGVDGGVDGGADMAMAAKKGHAMQHSAPLTHDRASVARGKRPDYGGIDLTKSSTPLDVRNAGQAVNFKIDRAQMASLNRRITRAPGLRPQVFTINPLQSLPVFLGMTKAEAQQMGA